jgi:hypothetical protein
MSRSLYIRIVEKVSEITEVEKIKIMRKTRSTGRVSTAKFLVLWTMRNRGYSHREIADAVGCDQSMAGYAFRSIERDRSQHRWVEEWCTTLADAFGFSVTA